jgi:hypothetical protein
MAKSNARQGGRKMKNAELRREKQFFAQTTALLRKFLCTAEQFPWLALRYILWVVLYENKNLAEIFLLLHVILSYL